MRGGYIGLIAALAIAGGGAIAVAAGGCVHEESTATVEETCACPEAEPVVDPALLAFLSKAKSVHELADILVADDKPAEAAVTLDELASGPLPGGEATPPEVREVLADTFARTAELRSEVRAFDQARRDIERGLELAPERTLFRGRLMEVRGVVEQRLHDQLREEGDEPAAERAKARAIEAFEAAVAIQDEVIQKTLEDAVAP